MRCDFSLQKSCQHFLKITYLVMVKEYYNQVSRTLNWSHLNLVILKDTGILCRLQLFLLYTAAYQLMLDHNLLPLVSIPVSYIIKFRLFNGAKNLNFIHYTCQKVFIQLYAKIAIKTLLLSLHILDCLLSLFLLHYDYSQDNDPKSSKWPRALV